jgi:hypothetical protein
MNEYSEGSPPHTYVLGHSQREIDRLKAQALLAAELVGTSGTVVGVDRVSLAIEEARKVTALSLKNVAFRVGAPADLAFDQPFDAVVGRCKAFEF